MQTSQDPRDLTALNAEFNSGEREIVAVAEVYALLHGKAVIIWLFIAHDTAMSIVTNSREARFIGNRSSVRQKSAVLQRSQAELTQSTHCIPKVQASPKSRAFQRSCFRLLRHQEEG